GAGVVMASVFPSVVIAAGVAGAVIASSAAAINANAVFVVGHRIRPLSLPAGIAISAVVIVVAVILLAAVASGSAAALAVLIDIDIAIYDHGIVTASEFARLRLNIHFIRRATPRRRLAAHYPGGATIPAPTGLPPPPTAIPLIQIAHFPTPKIQHTSLWLPAAPI